MDEDDSDYIQTWKKIISYHQRRDADPSWLTVQYWPTVTDAGPTLGLCLVFDGIFLTWYNRRHQGESGSVDLLGFRELLQVVECAAYINMCAYIIRLYPIQEKKGRILKFCTSGNFIVFKF